MAKNDAQGKLDTQVRRTRQELEALHDALTREIKKERFGRYAFVVVVLVLSAVMFGYLGPGQRHMSVRELDAVFTEVSRIDS